MGISANLKTIAGVSIPAGWRRTWLRVSLSTWMFALVAVALSGYALFGMQYYAAEKMHLALLKNNSIYIELDQHVSNVRAGYRIALMAAENTAVLPKQRVAAAVKDFADTARVAASANAVAALDQRFEDLRSAVAQLETAVAALDAHTGAVLPQLKSLGDAIDVLALITHEGRKAEWENLTQGSRSNFAELIVLLCTGALVVAGLGYFVTSAIRRVFADTVRINSAIAKGKYAIEIPAADERTEAGKLFAALRIFRDLAAERSQLANAAKSEGEARAERQKHIDARITAFRNHVRDLLTAVGGNMEQMRTTAKLLAQLSEDTTAQARGASGASQQASANVDYVASATEELAASTGEIDRQVSETTLIVQTATDRARATNMSVASLSESAQKIGEVVDLIRAIAAQTNLLALNATIEAARAGEMGRGFAVVAAEVKTLAGQTAKATEEIAAQIGAIQAATQQSAEAIAMLASTMEQINSGTSLIAASVARQGMATTEISRNVHQAASETQKVAVNMSGVTAAVGETMQSAGMVERASADVSDRMVELRETVNLFLEDVAAA